FLEYLECRKRQPSCQGSIQRGFNSSTDKRFPCRANETCLGPMEQDGHRKYMAKQFCRWSLKFLTQAPEGLEYTHRIACCSCNIALTEYGKNRLPTEQPLTTLQ